MIAPQCASNKLFCAPFYYGIWKGYAFILMFDSSENLLFTRSPSGGGNGNPAWDWQYRWKNIEINELYEYHGRLIYRPFTSRNEIIDCYLDWNKADKSLMSRLKEFKEK